MSKREDFQGEEKVRLISAVMYDVGHGVFPPGIYPLDVIPDNAFKAGVVRKIETTSYAASSTQTIKTGVRVKTVETETAEKPVEEVQRVQSEVEEPQPETENQIDETSFKKSKVYKKEVNYDN